MADSSRARDQLYDELQAVLRRHMIEQHLTIAEVLGLMEHLKLNIHYCASSPEGGNPLNTETA